MRGEVKENRLKPVPLKAASSQPGAMIDAEILHHPNPMVQDDNTRLIGLHFTNCGCSPFDHGSYVRHSLTRSEIGG